MHRNKKAPLFDHLVGTAEESGGDGEAKSICGL
jgi:hypothetical protein